MRSAIMQEADHIDHALLELFPGSPLARRAVQENAEAKKKREAEKLGQKEPAGGARADEETKAEVKAAEVKSLDPKKAEAVPENAVAHTKRESEVKTAVEPKKAEEKAPERKKWGGASTPVKGSPVSSPVLPRFGGAVVDAKKGRAQTGAGKGSCGTKRRGEAWEEHVCGVQSQDQCFCWPSRFLRRIALYG